MKKITSWIIVLVLMPFLLVGNAKPVSANQGITILINGHYQNYSHLAQVEKGRTLVPLRGIFEALHATVNYDSKQKTISASRGKTKVWLKIGSKQAVVNGKSIVLDVPAKVVKGNTIVPLRFISEAMGAEVIWEAGEKLVLIGDYTPGIVSDPIRFVYHTDREGLTNLDWLATNQSGKIIKSYTIYLSTFNHLDMPSYDFYTGESQFVLEYKKPVYPNDIISVSDVFTKQFGLSKVMLNQIEFEFVDGTKATQWYGHWVSRR